MDIFWKELLKTITKKHEEEVEEEKKTINELKKKFDIELPSKYFHLKRIYIY